MPDKETIKRAQKDRREGKSASTQAGEFVREEMHHIREGKHGAKSAKQAIAIGLSKARRAGVDLPPKPGTARTTRKPARSAPSRKCSRATLVALKREGHTAASHTALSCSFHDHGFTHHAQNGMSSRALVFLVVALIAAALAAAASPTRRWVSAQVLFVRSSCGSSPSLIVGYMRRPPP